MATKNISLTEEAYRRLRGLGKENESFSEIVIRITGKPSLSKFFGVLSRESGEKLEKAIEERRNKHRKSRFERVSRIVKELN
ncbi:MAG: antitoxin VapB family protein [Nanoarchaeota archaeon]